MRYCPHCGGEVSDTAKACGHCGRWLPQEAEQAPESVALPPSEGPAPAATSDEDNPPVQAPAVPASWEIEVPEPVSEQATPAMEALATDRPVAAAAGEAPSPPFEPAPAAAAAAEAASEAPPPDMPAPIAALREQSPKTKMPGWVWAIVGAFAVLVIAAALVVSGVLDRPAAPDPQPAAVAPTAVPAPTDAQPARSAEAQARYEAGRDLLDAGLAEAAYEAFDEAVALDPENPSYLRWRGNAALEVGDVDSAESDYSLALDLNLDDFFALANLAELHRSAFGDLEKALSFADRAIALDPDAAWPYVARAWVHRDGGNLESAVSDYSRAIQIEPEAWILAERCDAYTWLGSFDAALSDCNRAVVMEPDHAWYIFLRGQVYFEQGDLGRAITEYGEALEREPDQPIYTYERARAYNDMGDHEAALEDGDACVALASEEAWCYWHRGWAFDGLGDTDLAVEDFATYLDLIGEYDCVDCQEHAREYVANHGE